MSEKRFILAEDSNGLYSIFDTEDKQDNPLIYGAEFGTEKIIDLLNELNDENKTLKAQFSQLEEEKDSMNLFIKQTIEPLLWNCVFELNTIESMSQVELANKIENEIIPFIQNFKYLKYESPEEEKQDKSE